jgi:hypothetical protein
VILGVGAWIALCLVANGDSLAAQQPGAGIRYEGQVRIGDRPAPIGTPVIVIAPRSATDFTVCGHADVHEGGRYQLDVPALPDCIASTVEESRTLHIFVIHGENTGFQSNGSSLDEPRSLGRTFRQDLRGTDIAGFDPAQAPSDGSMPGVRYHGRLLLGDGPAPEGTAIGVQATRGGTLLPGCGSATVSDSNGNYWLDVPATPDCIAATVEERPTRHLFFVDGVQVASVSNGASLDLPRSVGETRKQDIRGNAHHAEQ